MKLRQIRVDGYKNLIECKVNLGDFNVLVGPNNSGKSNLLEAIQMLWPICFGDDRLRGAIFEGLTPPPRWSTAECHLLEHKSKPMTIGITLELGPEPRWVDYEVKIQWKDSERQKGGFVSESLRSKRTSDRGPAKTYLRREGTSLKVLGKSHKISMANSSLQAIRSLYPDFADLPGEIGEFVQAIQATGATRVFALSPKSLRADIDKENEIGPITVSSFDVLVAVDKIKEEGKHYDLFAEIVCDILDLEAVEFVAKDIQAPSQKGEATDTSKRARYLFITRPGDEPAFIEEYSDGTLLTAAILSGLFSTDVRSPILCLEELENCLHPAALKRLLRFLQENAERWPVLITTHSPYVLNGVNPEDVNVAVIDETGASHFEKIRNRKQLRDYLKTGLMSFGDLLISNFEEVLERE